METVTRRRVAIGGTFACDEALAVPLQYLLKNAVWDVDVDLQWLRYGSLTNFDTWSADVLHTDLVLLLVRLSDLEAAHPELHLSKKSDGLDGQEVDINCVPIQQFLNDLERYDALATNSTGPPLVVLLCPCPPTATSRFDAVEREIRYKIESMSNVSVRSSQQVLDLFQQQYSVAFYDAIADKRQHSPFTRAMLNVLSLALCRQISRLFRTNSRRKKVLVLDCDNTLWGGAIAEIGPSGIDLAPPFIALQRFVVAQQQRGMLLALCSKNISEDVAGAFEHRRGDMVLDLNKHVVATKINWQPKSENISQLAKELSLGLDSFIFIDDNPLECNEVATALPSVTVIPLGAYFSDLFLDREWVFDEGLSTTPGNSRASTNTNEDNERTRLYQQNFQREQLRGSASTHEAFLSALGVKIVFEELDEQQEIQERSPSFTRALQLHHRTNQFNTATTFAKRMEEETLLAYVATPGHTVICAHVTDRFGHYGLVSAALCRRIYDDDILRVDSFLLSCRALNRGVEHAMMRRLGEFAARTCTPTLEFVCEPTERNQPAQAFFSALSGVVFAASSDRQSKAVRSIAQSGTWKINADKANQVSFLKMEDSLHPTSIKPSGLISWLRHILPTSWLQDVALTVIDWVLSAIALPKWVMCLNKSSLVHKLGGPVSAGSLRVSLREHGSLEQLLSPALQGIPNVNNFETDVISSDSNEDDKFRRKARHQTKLTLVNHLHEEVPRVIWSANRPNTGGAEGSVSDTIDNSGSVASLQLVCKSPQCSATVPRDSRCSFHRCRNCCYRIQRLITRSLHHVNADARQSATCALEAQFAFEAFQTTTKGNSGPDTQWCQTHKNNRRRGEVYRKEVSET